MHAVVVEWCQVDRRKTREFSRGVEIDGEQVLDRVVEAFRLHDRTACDRTALAQPAVDWRHAVCGVGIDRACAVCKLAREEVIEVDKVVRHGPRDIVEFHVECFDELANQPVLDAWSAHPREAEHDRGQPVLGQCVLHGNEQYLLHVNGPRVE